VTYDVQTDGPRTDTFVATGGIADAFSVVPKNTTVYDKDVKNMIIF